MKFRHVLVLCVLPAVFATTGCDDYDAYPSGPPSASAPTRVICEMPMGSVQTTNTTADAGDTNGAGDTMDMTGTTDTATGGDTTAGLDPFWGAVTYDPNGTPTTTPPEGHHMAMTCLPCHSVGSSDVDAREFPWAFAGTVRQSNGGPGEGNVQIGIRSGTTLYVTYTSAGGHFWLPSGPSSWSNVEVRMRNAFGERVMGRKTGVTGDCNTCHGEASKNLVAPE